MSSTFRYATLFMGLAITNPLSAQNQKTEPSAPREVNAGQENPAPQPATKQAPRVSLDLADVVSVQPAKADTPTVMLDVGSPESRVREVTVTKTRDEQRTRLVEVDGERVEQAFTVKVPYTETVRQVYTVVVRAQQSVPTANIRGWDVDGNQLDEQELIDRLSNRPFVFLLKRPWPPGAELDPHQRAVLRDDVLLIHSASIKRGRPPAPVLRQPALRQRVLPPPLPPTR